MAQIAASISEASRTERQDDLIARLGRVRAATLARVASVDDTLARTQIDPDFSPLGWHLGHIAFIEALWLLEDGREAAFTATDRILWRADGLPRDQRGTTLPRLDEQIGILAETRKSVLATLERPFTRRVELLISFVLQHETMHAEIMGMLLALGDQREGGGFAGQDTSPPRIDLVKVPEGAFIQGHSGPEALDNERWPQRVARFPPSASQGVRPPRPSSPALSRRAAMTMNACGRPGAGPGGSGPGFPRPGIGGRGRMQGPSPASMRSKRKPIAVGSGSGFPAKRNGRRPRFCRRATASSAGA